MAVAVVLLLLGMALTNGLLATFDPTVLLNGTYAVRLVATASAKEAQAVQEPSLQSLYSSGSG